MPNVQKNANVQKMWFHFILGSLNYYVPTFKWIIWYNVLIVYKHVFTLYLYFKKYCM